RYGMAVQTGGGPVGWFYGPGRSGLVLSPALCRASALCLSRFPCNTFSLSPSLRGFYHSASTE
ncbi:hypothetical protein WCU54_08135, partial [Dickeya dadantii]